MSTIDSDKHLDEEFVIATRTLFHEAHLGSIQSLRFLSKGEFNSVYKLTTAEHGEEVLKIAPRDEGRAAILHSAAVAATKAREASVMTPRTRFIGANMPHLGNFAIEEYIPGRDLTKAEIPDYALQIATIMQRIHDVRLNGAGILDINGNGQQSDWQTQLVNFQEYCIRSIYESGAHTNIGDSLLEKIGEKLSRTSTYIPNMNHLVHGDPKHENIRIFEGGLALLDWEIAMSGDPIYDIAYIDTYDNNPLLALLILDTYKTSGYAENLEERFLHYQLTIGLKVLQRYSEIGDAARVEHYKEILNNRIS